MSQFNTEFIATFDEVLEGLAAYARTRADFAGVSVFTRNSGDINEQVDNALGKTGVSLEFFVSKMKPAGVQSQHVLYDPAGFSVEIFEDVALNRQEGGSKKGAWWLVEKLHANFNQRDRKTIPALQGPLIISKDEIEDLTKREVPNERIIQVHFETRLTVPLPQI